MSDGPGFVLPVDKPVGPTSHDVVASARRALGIRKIGHTGTLDPFASGLLVLCVGRATRLAEYLSGLDKSYEAVARLGVRTDTLDRDGAVLDESDAWRGLDEPTLTAALASFQGDIEQIPPQFSAKKVDGVAMHRRARRGEEVELPPCPVTVHEIELVEAELPTVRFRLRCSSGTYVRSVARDLGEALGCGAHLVELRRTAIGWLAVEDAIGADALEDPEAVAQSSIDPLAALAHLPHFTVGDEAARRIAHGQKLRLEEAVTEPQPYVGRGDGMVALSREGELVAVAEIADGVLRPRKVFLS